MTAGTLPRPLHTSSLSDVLGDPYRAGASLPLGPVLSLLDLACGRCAATFSRGPVVTGCLDDVSVFRTPLHGDVVHAHAEIFAVGRASMLVRVVVRVDVASKRGPARETLLKALATFVAVDERAAPRRVDAALPPRARDVPPADALPIAKAARAMLWEGDAGALAAVVARRVPRGAWGFASARANEAWIASRVVVRRQFLPRHQNRAGKVFGGDIIEALEAVALASARRGGGGACRTIAVRALAFVRAVEVDEVLQVEATVVGGGAGGMTVVVRSFVDEKHDGKQMRVAHAGVFHVRTEGTVEGDMAVAQGENGLEGLRALAMPMGEEVREAWGLRYPAANFVKY